MTHDIKVLKISNFHIFPGITLATNEPWEQFYQKNNQIGMQSLEILPKSNALYQTAHLLNMIKREAINI